MLEDLGSNERKAGDGGGRAEKFSNGPHCHRLGHSWRGKKCGGYRFSILIDISQ